MLQLDAEVGSRDLLFTPIAGHTYIHSAHNHIVIPVADLRLALGDKWTCTL